MLLLVGMLWFAYSIVTFTLKESTNDNLDYIPENAIEVSRIDGQIFFKKTLKTLILHQDDDLSEMLREIKKNRTSTGIKPLGILFNSEIIQFKVTRSSKILTGYLFNLNSPHYFKRNIRNYFGENAAVSTNENVGLVMLQGKSNLTKSKLQSIAKNLLSKKSSFSKKNPISKSQSVLTFWNKSKQGSTISLSASINRERLEISGDIFDKSVVSEKHTWLEPDGLHFSSMIIPDSWNEYVKKSFNDIGVSLPKITSISMNYFGCTLISEPTILIAPKADIVLTFDAPVEIDSLFKGFGLSSEGAPKNFKKLNIYGEKYLVGATAPNQLMIYHSRMDKIQYKSTSNALQFIGSPKYLFKIEGDNFIKRLMGMSPSVVAAQELVSQVSSIEITGKISRKKAVTIDGKVQFREGQFPLNALFKFLLRSKIFE